MTSIYRTAVVAILAGVLLGACATANSEKSVGKPIADITVAGSSTSAVPGVSDTGGGPTTTAAGVKPTTTTAVARSVGTFDDPVAAGEWTEVGDVEVVVVAVNQDAADLVLEENLYNDPPAPGNRFVLWQIVIANMSDTELAAFGAVSFSVVGDSAVAYAAFDATCGVVPDSLDTFRTLFPGGSLAGSLCWEVAEQDVASLKLIVDEFAFSGARTVIAQPGVGETFEVTYPAPVLPDTTGAPGSRGNPLAIGDTVGIGDWEITITGFNPDATASVLAENQFNDPPADGHKFVTVGVSAEYVGQDSDSLFAGVDFGAVGDLAVSLTSEEYCGVIPNGLDTFSEAFPGGVVAGDLCWEVDERDIGSLLVYMSESFSFDSVKVFVELS